MKFFYLNIISDKYAYNIYNKIIVQFSMTRSNYFQMQNNVYYYLINTQLDMFM